MHGIPSQWSSGIVEFLQHGGRSSHSITIEPSSVSWIAHGDQVRSPASQPSLLGLERLNAAASSPAWRSTAKEPPRSSQGNARRCSRKTAVRVSWSDRAVENEQVERHEMTTDVPATHRSEHQMMDSTLQHDARSEWLPSSSPVATRFHGVLLRRSAGEKLRSQETGDTPLSGSSGANGSVQVQK